ncbi:Chloride intracellular channel exc-4 [Armadillidium vulgare]|nr:Chloride intracellular channel exc-4 [Armadillidium vulgare]
MKNIPGGHNLFVQDKEVASKIENVYSKFKLMLLKKDEASKNILLAHLRKINDHLEQRGTRFLTGDTMCCFDCELMPKLQHLRLAGEFLLLLKESISSISKFQLILNIFGNTWTLMYHLDAFNHSCPADQDIINHYKHQQGARMKKHEELETPTFTNSVPVQFQQ